MHLLWIIIAAENLRLFLIFVSCSYAACCICESHLRKSCESLHNLCVYFIGKAYEKLLDNFSVIAWIFSKFTVRLKFSFLLPRVDVKRKCENVQFHSTHNFPKSYKLQRNFHSASRFLVDGHTLRATESCVFFSGVFPSPLWDCEKVKIALFSFINSPLKFTFVYFPPWTMKTIRNK